MTGWIHRDMGEWELLRTLFQYAPLACLLEKSGFPVGRVFATRGSELERTMKADAQGWLVAER
ncbi:MULTISPECIES: hypothetical protein [Paraburkholderia]|uniref:hypothetical protein n=1 Tax=Paraburkholderia TaxID=1822464 RepID=UPI002255F41D|nr:MULTISPECIES: hypothetical protein [Paraburkholderia]MCX4163051.1 hypothetical protein [Paraburkholderia megapolitana]MDN7158547.1 hypothetical protein [Paraburkholderia sp. CHISQ3]MDQ6495594.1 hypothetical protein [Paraburkholderia megapolitana]